MNCCLKGADSGTHIIIPLSNGAGDEKLTRRLAEKGLVLRPLSPYYMTNEIREGLLFGFSAFNEAEIAKGLNATAAFKDEIGSLIAVER